MKITLLPKTPSGNWSVGFSISFIILIWLKMQYNIPVMTFGIAALGLIGFFISVIAIIRKRDYSILNFLPVLVGLVIILWIIGELTYPH